MKIIKRIFKGLDGWLDLVAEAFIQTAQADQVPSGSEERNASGSSFVAIDVSIIGELGHQEQLEARSYLNGLLWRTRRKLGPGEWLQVIRRNKNDGRFMPGPEDEGNLF